MGTKGNKPTHQVFLVREARSDAEPARYTSIGVLWPTKSGAGFSGPLRLTAPMLLPADGLRIFVQAAEDDDRAGPPVDNTGTEIPE
jgi:hypothetical protein